MAYTELVTLLRADYGQLKKDLEEGLRLNKQYLEQAQRLATVALRAGGSAGGGGRAGGGRAGTAVGSDTEVNRALQNMQRLKRAVLEVEDTAEHRALQRIGRLDVALAENAKKEEIATRKGIEDKDKAFRYIEGQRQAAEAQQRRMSAIQAQAEKEDAARTRQAETEKEKIVKQALDQKVGETRAANAKLQALAAEELARSKAEAKALADAEKEFAQFVNTSLRQGGQQALVQAKVKDAAEETEKSFQKLGEVHLPKINQLMTQFRQAVRVTAGYTAAIGAGSIVAGFALLAKEAVEVNVTYERNRQVIAQILGLTSQWVDAQGKAVSQTRQLNLNYAEADRLLPQIRQQAARLNLTFEEAASVFRTGFGLALQRGITPEQAVPIIGQIAELSKALGAGSLQSQLREIRALLGGIRPAQSRIVTALGIDPAGLRQAREAGTTLQYLNQVFQKGQPYLRQYESSWEVLTTTLASSAQELIRISTQRTFEKVTGNLADFNRQFTPERIKDWGETVSTYLTATFNIVKGIVKALNDFVNHPLWERLRILPGIAILRAAAAAPGAIIGAAVAEQQARQSQQNLTATRQQIAGTVGGRLSAAIVGQRQRVRIAQTELNRTLQGGEGSVPLAIRVYEHELDALSQLQQQERKFTQDHQAELGKRAQATAEQLHLEVIRHEEASKAKQKAAEREALYLARLRAKAKDDDVEKIHAELSAEIEASKKSVVSAQGRQEAIRLINQKYHQKLVDMLADQRLQAAKDIADDLGDKKSAAIAEAQLNAKKAQDDIEDENLKAARIAAIRTALNQKLKDIDQEFNEKAIDYVKQYRDAIHKETEERVALHKEAADLETGTGKELIRLAKERKEAIKELYRTQAEEALRARNAEIAQSRQDLRDRARGVLERTGVIRRLQIAQFSPEGLEPLRSAAQAELQQQTGQASFSQEDLATIDQRARQMAQERLNANIEQAIDQAVTSNFVRVPGAVTPFGGQQSENVFTGLGTAGQQLDLRQNLNQRAEQRQSVAEQVADVGKAFAAAQQRVVELDNQQKELVKQYQEAAKQLREHFNNDLREIHDTLSKLAPEFKQLLREIQVSHGVIPPALRQALGVGARGATAGQVAAALGGAPQTININLTVPDTSAAAHMIGNVLRAHGLRANPVTR